MAGALDELLRAGLPGTPLLLDPQALAPRQAPAELLAGMFQPTETAAGPTSSPCEPLASPGGAPPQLQPTPEPPPADPVEPAPGLVQLGGALEPVTEGLAGERVSACCCQQGELFLGTLDGTVHVFPAPRTEAGRQYRGISPTAVVGLGLSPAARVRMRLLAVLHQSGLLWLLQIQTGRCVVSIEPPQLPLTVEAAGLCWATSSTMLVIDKSRQSCWCQAQRRFQIWQSAAGRLGMPRVHAMAAAPGGEGVVAVVQEGEGGGEVQLMRVTDAGPARRQMPRPVGGPASVEGVLGVWTQLSWWEDPAMLAVGCGSWLSLLSVDNSTKRVEPLLRLQMDGVLRGVWWASPQAVLVATRTGYLQTVHCDTTANWASFAALASVAQAEFERSVAAVAAVPPIPLPVPLVAEARNSQVLLPDRSALLVGHTGVCTAHVLSWQQRVDHQIAANQWPEAFSLVVDLWRKSQPSLAQPAIDLVAC